MNGNATNPQATPPAEAEAVQPVGYDFGLSRRGFVQVLGAGLLVAVQPHARPGTTGRRAGRRPGRAHDFGPNPLRQGRNHYGPDRQGRGGPGGAG